MLRRHFAVGESHSAAVSDPRTARFSLLAAVFFALLLLVVCFGLLHPGYETSDDVGMIALASGYVGGTRVPFLMYSNVLYGLLLVPLYGLPGHVNWEVVTFVALDLAASVGLAYVVLARRRSLPARAFALSALMIVASHVLHSITFTTTAAFASLSGFCLLLQAASKAAPRRLVRAAAGTLLVVAGSLVRLDSMLLSLCMLLPALALCLSAFDLRRLALLLSLPVALALGAQLADHAYVSGAPAWSVFRRYDEARSMLHDSPRIENVRSQTKRVGWSKNDLESFRSWFFPDSHLYSFEHLQKLKKLVSDKRRGEFGTELTILNGLTNPACAPFLLLGASVALAVLARARGRRDLLPLAAMLGTCLACVWFLAWSMKLPSRVLVSLVGALVVYGLAALDWLEGAPRPDEPSIAPDDPFRRGAAGGAWLLLLAALGLASSQSIRSDAEFANKRAVYARMLSDLDALSASGKLAAGALIVSPGCGLPLEWADPLRVDFPHVEYLPMGWLTFSPSFDAALARFGVSSLTEAFSSGKPVYLVARAKHARVVEKFLREHGRPDLKLRRIHALPRAAGDRRSRQLVLYRAK